MHGNRKGTNFKKRKSRWGVPSWFKRLRKRKHRAKEKDAIRNEKDVPEFKRTDRYDWF